MLLRHLLLIFVSCACLLGAGCGGGGGGGGGTSISVSPKSLSFHSDPSSAPAAQVVTVTFEGDGVVVGYPPDSEPAYWLNVAQQGEATAGQVTFAIQPFPTGPDQTQTTTLRFLTGHANGPDINDADDIKYQDVKVTYVVRPMLSVSPTVMEFSAIDGSAEEATPGDRFVVVTGSSSAEWTATVDAAWVHLEQSAGSGSYSNLFFQIDHANLGPGHYTALITLQDATRGETATATLNLSVRAPRLVVAPEQLSFAIDGGTTADGLTKLLSISDELGGTDASRAIDWSVASIDAPWLSIRPRSGMTVPAASVEARLDKQALGALSAGHHTANVTLRYTSGNSRRQELVVPVELDIALPALRTASPYAGFTDVASEEIVLSGTGLAGLTADRILFGRKPATAVRLLSDNVMAATRPPLAEGAYPVRVTNVLGTATSATEVRILSPDAFQPDSIDNEAPVKRLLFDPIRRVLYAISTHIRRYQYDGLHWIPMDDVRFPIFIRAGRLSRDLSKLYVAGDYSFYSLDADDPAAEPQLLGEDPNRFCGPYLGEIIPFFDDRVTVIEGSAQCSPWHEAGFVFDPLAGTFTQEGWAYGGNWPAALVPDNLLYAYVNIDGYGTMQYDLVTGPTTHSLNWYIPSDNNAISRDASRLIAIDSIVTDENLTRLGHLPGAGTAMVSPDGKRAYAVSGEDNRVYVYDLTQIPLDPGGQFPEITTFPISTDPSYSRQYVPNVVAISPDGRTLFLAEGEYGGNTIYVVPIPRKARAE